MANYCDYLTRRMQTRVSGSSTKGNSGRFLEMVKKCRSGQEIDWTAITQNYWGRFITQLAYRCTRASFCFSSSLLTFSSKPLDLTGGFLNFWLGWTVRSAESASAQVSPIINIKFNYTHSFTVCNTAAPLLTHNTAITRLVRQATTASRGTIPPIKKN